MQRASVTQDGKDQVSDVDGVVEIQVGKTNGIMDLPVNEENVSQNREQVGLQSANNSPIDKSLFRGINQFQLYAAFTAQDVNIEIFKRDSNSLLLSVKLPEFSTASEQLRNS